jgi:hypothetical protein
MFDIEPVLPGVEKIYPYGKLPIENIDSIILDLPFVVAPLDSFSVKANHKNSNIIQKRFSSYPNKNELFKSYRHWINECYRVLADEGLMIIKTQGCVSCGIQLFIPQYCFMVALKCGFYALDEFFLTGERIHSGKIQNQIHSRKHVSSFLIFKKTDKKKVDYFGFLK